MINEVDLVLYVVFAIGFILGLYFGLVGQLGTLISVWCGVFFSGMLSPLVGGYITSIFDVSPTTVYLASFIIAFIIIGLGVKLLSLLLLQCLNFMGGALLNRVLGGLLGFFISALTVSVALNLKECFLPKHLLRNEINESRLYTLLIDLAPKVIPRLSVFLDSTSDKISDFVSNETV